MRGLRGAVAAAVVLGLAHPALAWDQPQWVRQLGTADDDSASGVATDAAGNVYLTGYGSGDVLLAKYSAAGTLRWKRQLGTAGGDAAQGAATDDDGNVYIAGETSGSLGGPNQGLSDAWVAKYSAAGALRWKRQLGTVEWDFARGVATDGDGNVYIAGETEGSLGGPQQGNGDAWVAKYSAAGALRWKRQLGTVEFDGADGIAADDDGNACIAGQNGPLGNVLHAWVAKYSAAGALRWKRQLEDDWAIGVATDGDGNVYIAGVTSGDAWVANYSAAGALRWKRQLGTVELDAATGVATDGDGNVYIAGKTSGSLGGPNQGYYDAWVAQYSTRP